MLLQADVPVLRTEILGLAMAAGTVLMLGLLCVVAMMNRHRERMAMIQRGEDPDSREKSQ